MTPTRRSSLEPMTWPHDFAGRAAPAAISADDLRKVRRLSGLMVGGGGVDGLAAELHLNEVRTKSGAQRMGTSRRNCKHFMNGGDATNVAPFRQERHLYR